MPLYFITVILINIKLFFRLTLIKHSQKKAIYPLKVLYHVQLRYRSNTFSFIIRRIMYIATLYISYIIQGLKGN